jgi:endonuclease YncB( thermonuclease family)
MREYITVSATRRLVAFALAAGLVGVTGGAESPLSARTGDASRGPISGMARVVDGDTLDVGEARVRLEGIDAPEAGQSCKRKWVGAWACGAEATAALARAVDGKAIVCEQRGVDKYGRTLGVCFADGRDINAMMVRQGYAWAFVKYSTSYVKEETAAKAESRGIWQGPSVPAWEYRHQRWAAVEAQAPNGCAIKGNITRNGKIYHMPWSPWYAQIKMEPEKGKRWFCTEAEALAAGWRPVQMQ